MGTNRLPGDVRTFGPGGWVRPILEIALVSGLRRAPDVPDFVSEPLLRMRVELRTAAPATTWRPGGAADHVNPVLTATVGRSDNVKYPVAPERAMIPPLERMTGG